MIHLLLNLGLVFLIYFGQNNIIISEKIYKNIPHFEVETPAATYYIEKQSGGCSLLIDSDGNDWISFHKTENPTHPSSAASDYRGLPNLVYHGSDNGVGHPGSDICSTVKVGSNELIVNSNSGKWQYRWIFREEYAVISVEKVDTSRNYWFLYEGPVGGKFYPKTHYYGNDKEGICFDQPEISSSPKKGNWQWFFFGDLKINRCFFVSMSKHDEFEDFFAYMGDSNTGVESAEGMNVFGFGRNRKVHSLLSQKNKFIIGFYESQIQSEVDYSNFKKYINNLIQVNY